MKKLILVMILGLATGAFAQNTTTLQGNTCSWAPASTHGCNAYGMDGMYYGFSANSISFQFANASGYTSCTTPYQGAFTFQDLTAEDQNFAEKLGPYQCANGTVVGVLVKYYAKTVKSGRAYHTVYFLTSGTVTTQ